MRPINLLPPEVAEERNRRRRIGMLIVAGIAYVLLLVAGVLACLAGAVIVGFAIYAGVRHASGVWSSLTPMLGFSMGWIFVSLPVGFALLLLHAVRMLLEGGPESVFRNATELVVADADTR